MPTIPALQAESAGPTDLSAEERAKRILRTLLASQGPIVLVVPGTKTAPYAHGGLKTVETLLKRHRGAMAIAAIPYRADALTMPLSVRDGRNVLRLVLEGLARSGARRPIYLVGDSQGAWIVSDLLRDPNMARIVTRSVLFALPGMATGSKTTPDRWTNVGFRKTLTIQHTDDAVSAWPHSLNSAVIKSLAHAATEALKGKGLHYSPHHYSPDGAAAARFLLTGTAPAQPHHASSVHS